MPGRGLSHCLSKGPRLRAGRSRSHCLSRSGCGPSRLSHGLRLIPGRAVSSLMSQLAFASSRNGLSHCLSSPYPRQRLSLPRSRDRLSHCLSWSSSLPGWVVSFVLLSQPAFASSRDGLSHCLSWPSPIPGSGSLCFDPGTGCSEASQPGTRRNDAGRDLESTRITPKRSSTLCGNTATRCTSSPKPMRPCKTWAWGRRRPTVGCGGT